MACTRECKFAISIVLGLWRTRKKSVHESHYKHINYPPLSCSRILNFLLFSISIIDNNNNNEMYIVYILKCTHKRVINMQLSLGYNFMHYVALNGEKYNNH